MNKIPSWVAASLIVFFLFCPLTSRAQTSNDAEFQALGGKVGVAKIAAELVTIVLLDPRIKQTFKGVDTERLKEKLAEQFCAVSGGGCTYSGKDMTTIHDGLSITNAQFNALVEDLQRAMERCAIPPHAQNKLLAKLAPMQRNIVTQ